MLFIEETSPPPFYQEQLTQEQRVQLDKWFIGHRSQRYYLKRFAQFDTQGYLSPKWNWAAFFATFGWLLYRKRYLDCIVYTVAGWSFIQLNVVIILVAFEFAFMSFVPDAYQMATRILIALLIWIFWAAMVARWADAYYYRMARREIADVLADYPREPKRQQEHLQREGGVSVVGMGFAFGLFSFLLMVIYQQFLPIYAQPKEKGVINDTFVATRIATTYVEERYQGRGDCPIGERFDNLSAKLNDNLNETANNYLSLEVVQQTPALGNRSSSCALIARIKNVPFPNRNLNGQTYIMYRSDDVNNDIEPNNGVWRCVTSLNKKQKPHICQTE